MLPNLEVGIDVDVAPRRIGQPFVALNVDPLAEGPIMPRTEAKKIIGKPKIATATDGAEGLASATLEKWDYVLRQLFILKSTPLEKAIQYVNLFRASLAIYLLGE